MIALDIETELDARGFYSRNLTVASAADTHSGALRQYSPASVYELIDQLPYVDRILGYNLVSFDLPVLSLYSGWAAPLNDICKTFDLYREMTRLTGRRDISLDDLARGTLGAALPQHGGRLASLGQTRRLYQHSANGVIEINAIYRFGLANRFLRWMGPLGQLYETTVDWAM